MLETTQPKSNLPSWMRPGPTTVVENKTRETTTEQRASVNIRADTTVAQPVQTQTASAPSQSQLAKKVVLQDWETILLRSIAGSLGVAFTGLVFFAPFILSWLMTSFGLVPKRGGGWEVFFTYMGLCYIIAVWLQVREARKAKTTAQYPISSSSTGPLTPTAGPFPYRTPGSSTTYPSTGSSQVVASRIRAKYHRPNCRWAYKISRSNRMSFPSSTVARQRG